MIYPDIIGTKESAAAEVALRQELVQVALGRAPADLVLRVGTLLNVHAAQWLTDWEIVIKGERIAWTGPGGTWPGKAARRVHHPDLTAVPGFGEVHKHIESTHITPEYEAELVLPFGNTWTCEGILVAAPPPRRAAQDLPADRRRGAADRLRELRRRLLRLRLDGQVPQGPHRGDRSR